MLARAERATGTPKAGQLTGRVWGGTFHAVGNRLLRLHGRALGLCARLHRARPGRRRRRDEPAARGARLRRAGAPLPAQGDARRDLLAHRQRRREARRRAEAPLPLVPRRGRRHPRGFPRLHRPQARAARPGLRRPAAVLEGARVRRCRRASSSRPCSTTCWSTSTRTRTRCRPTSSRGCGRPVRRGTSRSSATTRSRSTGSARRRCATSWSSRSGSPAPSSSSSSRTTARRRRSSPSSNAAIALSPQRHEKTLWSERPGERDARRSAPASTRPSSRDAVCRTRARSIARRACR